MNKEELLYKYLEELSQRFPTKEDATTEIINLNAILALPRGVEHYMSDLHGQADAFNHIINNASGNTRFKIKQLFKGILSKERQDELATIIYYPEEKINQLLPTIENQEEWFKKTLYEIIETAKKISSRYTRSKVKKQYDENLSYILDELLNNNVDQENKEAYYKVIIDSIIELGYAEKIIKSLSDLIKILAVDELHIVGDIYDRGPEPHKIMEILRKYHSVDIQWGNHDILWIGSAIGSNICVSGVITNSVRHNNLDIIEDTYGINLRPLANFAERTYDEALVWKPRKTTEEDYYNNPTVKQAAKIHKAISVIMYKLEGQFALNHPEYKMMHRRLLDKIDYENSSITIDGEVYHLEDIDFPTIDKSNPYELTIEEEKIINDLTKSFLNSEVLQTDIKVFFDKGSMYKIENNVLMYHALVPLNEDGSLKEVNLGPVKLKGKDLFDYIDCKVRKLYYNREKNNQQDLDLMWFLWSGSDSPFFGKDKMTTLERVLIKDKASHYEKKNPYYNYQDNVEIVESIMKNFGMTDLSRAHIVTGHVPVAKGESPLKAGGKLLVIDGGFSKSYQKTTGHAGYTLVSGSSGMRLITHKAFTSIKDAIINNTDIESSINTEKQAPQRQTIGDTDKGKELRSQIESLKLLIKKFDSGEIKEQHRYIYLKQRRNNK